MDNELEWIQARIAYIENTADAYKDIVENLKRDLKQRQTQLTEDEEN